MRLHQPRSALVLESRDIPTPGPGQVLLRVRACGVCRTDLHVADGELAETRLPIVPGHEIMGEILACGADVTFPTGARMGVPWLGYTCGHCEFCAEGEENLCDSARFTGYQLDGGYADHVIADARYCFGIPHSMDDAHAAPLLCAGLIGYRSWRMAGDSRRLGIYGFGAAAHIVTQVACSRAQDVYAFTRSGDHKAQRFARQMGACWAGDSDALPPAPLDAAIIFAPVGELVPRALQAVRKGGTVVCGGIHMSDLPSMPYSLLRGERVVRSVANLTRTDGTEFLQLAAHLSIVTQVETFALPDANLALDRLRTGQITGAAVLIP